MKLLSLLLKYNFWNENKNKILKEMFPSNLFNLYDLIITTHGKLHRDLSLNEIKELYNVSYPNETKTKLNFVYKVLDDAPRDISEDIAKEILTKAWTTEIGRQITQFGIDIVNGETSSSLSQARTIFEKIEQGNVLTRDELIPVSDNIEEILEAISITTKWHFNLEPLKVVASGIGPGIFTIIAARVEIGKTCMWISLCAAPGGFVSQGAKVHCYCNEEPAQRTQGRAVMAHTGMTLQEILLDVERAKYEYARIKENIKFFNCKGKNIEDIAEHINKYSPDIVIVDQLDKLSIRGTFAREDERLGSLYIRAREIADIYSCAMVAITQLHADAEGKSLLNSANLAGARTAKAAEGDLIIGIGKNEKHGDKVRILNMIKNKITGENSDIICLIQSEISRFIA